MSEINQFDKIESVKKITREAQDPTKDVVDNIDPKGSSNRDHFEALMQQGKTKVAAIEEPSKNTPMEQAARDHKAAVNHDLFQPTSPDKLIAQTERLVGQIDDIKSKLNTPNLEIKGSVQSLLKNKLSHVDDSLRIALTKAGGEYNAPEQQTGVTNPIDRFLGLLTNGQSEISNLTNDLKVLQDNPKAISPANLLLIQIKVGYIQQELEFFSNVLNKALESTKTIMNVQV